MSLYLDKQEFFDFFSEGLAMYLDSVFKTDQKYHLEDFYMNVETFLHASNATVSSWAAVEAEKDA